MLITTETSTVCSSNTTTRHVIRHVIRHNALLQRAEPTCDAELADSTCSATCEQTRGCDDALLITVTLPMNQRNAWLRLTCQRLHYPHCGIIIIQLFSGKGEWIACLAGHTLISVGYCSLRYLLAINS